VLVDATVNPDIASLIHNEWNYGSLPHTTEELPNGALYGHPDPIPPDHTYELTEITYDVKKGKFNKPYPWKQPHSTWDDLITVRNSTLAWSDFQLMQAPPDQKKDWEDFRQLLRDLPKTFKDVDPWKVPFPHHPNSESPTVTVGSLESRSM
jgi:hypothetical protein